MTGFNVILATLVLVLLLSNLHLLAVNAYIGAYQVQHKLHQQPNLKQPQQHQRRPVLHHTRHHHSISTSESDNDELTTTPPATRSSGKVNHQTHKQPHQYHHNRQEQQQQSLQEQRDVASNLQQFKPKGSHTRYTTTKPIIANAIKEPHKSQHNHHHQQQQQQQLQQPHQRSNNHNYQSNLHQQHHHHHQYEHYSTTPTPRPSVPHSPSNTILMHIPYSHGNASASVHHAHNRLNGLIATPISFGEEAKSMSDASLQRNFKATMHNRQENLKWSEKLPDYYYDMDYEDDEVTNEEAAVGDEEAAEAETNQDYADDEPYRDSAERFPAAEPRQNLAAERKSALIQDYADDEPYRDSSAEQFQADAPGSLTDQKFRELGTKEAVQQSRDKYMQLRQKTPADLAREHLTRVQAATKCSRPMPRVIHVSNDTSKRYVPYCTILHRCGEDTGCCETTRHVCTVKSYEDVPVYFFVMKVNSANRHETEVLMLRNHTECHCVNRISLTNMARGKRSGGLTAASTISENRLFQSSATTPKCSCPRHFDVFEETVEQSAGHQRYSERPQPCRCDCMNTNLPCRRLQDGDEGFAMADRKCIAELNCKAPTCSHGDYSTQTGRCPRLRNHKRHNYGFG